MSDPPKINEAVFSPPKTAVVVEAAIDRATLAMQLTALQATVSDHSAEVIIVAPSGVPALDALLAQASGAKVVRCSEVPGRLLSQRIGAQSTDAEVLVYLGPMAVPGTGLLQQLVAAVRAGASFAGPVIDGVGALEIAEDGSLRPTMAGSGQPTEALALDCLAARRDVWLDLPAALPMREGFPEVQLARWARSHGPLALCGSTSISRADNGPISIVICSRDRADELAELVPLLVAFGATADGGEIVVVDNASSDETPEVVGALAREHPGVVYVLEEEPGLSAARNAGARAATHRGICYIDDDARPNPGWHKSIAWGLTRANVAAAGGPIAGLWPPERLPGWPDPGLEGNFGVLDNGDAIKVISPPEQEIWGGNWAANSEALAAVGGFSHGLGLAPGQRIGGEESSLSMRLVRAGLGAVVYSPWANVGHRIAARKLSDAYLIEHQLISGFAFHQLVPERYAGESGQALLLSEVTDSLSNLLRIVPMSGRLTVTEALNAIEAAAGSLTDRVRAARSLGLVGGGVLQLGEDELELEDLTIAFNQENLRGHVR